jgi:hypothetical protein
VPRRAQLLLRLLTAQGEALAALGVLPERLYVDHP